MARCDIGATGGPTGNSLRAATRRAVSVRRPVMVTIAHATRVLCIPLRKARLFFREGCRMRRGESETGKNKRADLDVFGNLGTSQWGLARWGQSETHPKSTVAQTTGFLRYTYDPQPRFPFDFRIPSNIFLIMAPSAARSRFVLLALFGMALFTFLILGAHRSVDGQPSPIQQAKLNKQGGGSSGAVLTGHAIAPKLGNATAKYD